MTVLAGFVPMLANFFPTLRDVNAFIERVKPAPPEDVSAFGGPAAPKTDARPISK